MSDRRRLPKRRKSKTVYARVGGHKLYVSMGEYEDGTLGEIFLDMHKVGATFRGIMHCFARLFSIALQYGVPLRVLVKAFRGVEFEPRGKVEGHKRIETASSLVDYLVRAVACEYLAPEEQEEKP
jgi:ribonucleoside-diphosphate reductase alpha chain